MADEREGGGLFRFVRPPASVVLFLRFTRPVDPPPPPPPPQLTKDGGEGGAIRPLLADPEDLRWRARARGFGGRAFWYIGGTGTLIREARRGGDQGIAVGGFTLLQRGSQPRFVRRNVRRMIRCGSCSRTYSEMFCTSVHLDQSSKLCYCSTTIFGHNTLRLSQKRVQMSNVQTNAVLSKGIARYSVEIISRQALLPGACWVRLAPTSFRQFRRELTISVIHAFRPCSVLRLGIVTIH